MNPEVITFTKVGRSSRVRSLYEGYCSFCGEIKYHRLVESTPESTTQTFKCMNCGDKTTVEKQSNDTPTQNNT